MKLTLAGVSHHRAPIELRERVALDLDAVPRARRPPRGRGGRALDLQPHRALPRPGRARRGARGRTLAELAGDRGDDSRRALPAPRRGGGAPPLPRRRPGSTRSSPARARSSARCAPPSRRARPGRSSTGSSGRRCTPAGRVRLETAIGESPASVPSAAAALAQQVFGDLAGARVLLLGAGKMSEATARNLVSRGAEIAVVANRTLAHGEDLARRLGARRSPSTRSRPSSSVPTSSSRRRAPPGTSSTRDASPRRCRAQGPAACCSSTSPCRATSTRRSTTSTAASSTTSTTSRPSSPRRSPGRRSEAARAERLVAEEADRFREWQASLDVVPTIASLRALAEEIRDSELARAGGRLSESERRHVESVTSQILAKLLHLPTIRMKEAAAAADGVVYADVVRHLFGLEEEGAAAMTTRFLTGRPLPLQVPTAFVRIRPSSTTGVRGCGESKTRRRGEAVLIRVGSRGSRLALTQAEQAAERLRAPWGSRSRSCRSRRRATATGRSRSARSAPAASSSRSSRRRCSPGGSTSPSTRPRT